MYKQVKNPDGTISTEMILKTDKGYIPFDPANTDYQEYLKWVADGGIVEPADTPEEAE